MSGSAYYGEDTQMLMKTFCETPHPPLVGAPPSPVSSAFFVPGESIADLSVDRIAFLSCRVNRRTGEGFLTRSSTRSDLTGFHLLCDGVGPLYLTLGVFEIRDTGLAYYLGNVSLEFAGAQIPIGALVNFEILKLFEAFRASVETGILDFSSPIEAVRHMRRTRGRSAH